MNLCIWSKATRGNPFPGSTRDGHGHRSLAGGNYLSKAASCPRRGRSTRVQAWPGETSSCIARLIQQHLGRYCTQGALQDTRTSALTAEEPCLQFCNTCDKRHPGQPPTANWDGCGAYPGPILFWAPAGPHRDGLGNPGWQRIQGP